MFTYRFSYRFEAAHRFIHSPSLQCSTPHGHSWTAVLALGQAGMEPLDTKKGMLEEFSVLKHQWKQFIEQVADHSFLHHEADPLKPVLQEATPEFRGLPFPADPTTELIAGCFLWKAIVMSLERDSACNVQPVGVEVRETPTNAVFLAARSRSELVERAPVLAERAGWWTDPVPEARWID